MITYRVTVSIPTDVFADWLAWMQHQHIPDVLATGCFVAHHVRRVLDPATNVTTVVIDYMATSIDAYHDYAANRAPALQAQHSERYGATVTASRLLLTDELRA